jgi:hypothetical protein
MKGQFGTKEDTTQEHSEEFLFSKAMWKYKSTGPMYHIEGPGRAYFRPITSTIAYDGNRIKRYNDAGKPVESAASIEKFDPFTCFWMTWNFRPCSCEGGFASSRWHLTPLRSVLAGENHFALEENDRQLRTTCWINEKNFTIGRVTRKFMEHLVYQTDFKYKRIEPHGFLPIEWKNSTWSSEGGTSVIDTSISEVTDWKINEPIKDQELSFEFPSGARVRGEDGSLEQARVAVDASSAKGWWSVLTVTGVVMLLVLWRVFARRRAVP